jgi:hypothetical protein
MRNCKPENAMLDFIGIIGIATATVVTITAVLGALPIPPRARLSVALLLGAWIGVAVALGANGSLAVDGSGPIPLLGVLFAAPLAAAALLVVLVPAARAALLALPLPLLLGLNVWRVLGGLFFLLAADGRLGGPFPQFAGWGDVITGVLALPVAWLAARAPASTRDIALAWNAFGALDLVVAVSLGVVSANGSPLQLIHAGAGSAAMQHLPWSVVPTVLVPAYLVLHAVIHAQLRRAGRSVGAARPAVARV